MDPNRVTHATRQARGLAGWIGTAVCVAAAFGAWKGGLLPTIDAPTARPLLRWASLVAALSLPLLLAQAWAAKAPSSAEGAAGSSPTGTAADDRARTHSDMPGVIDEGLQSSLTPVVVAQRSASAVEDVISVSAPIDGVPSKRVGKPGLGRISELMRDKEVH
jgi:hypothetical protein